MNDAGLDNCLGKHRGNRLGKAFEPVDHGDQNVTDAAGLDPVHDFQPELGALGLLDSQPENFFLALTGERQGDIDRLVADQALVTDLDPQRVEKDHRVDPVARPVLSSRVCPFATICGSKLPLRSRGTATSTASSSPSTVSWK